MIHHSPKDEYVDKQRIKTSNLIECVSFSMLPETRDTLCASQLYTSVALQ
jgi:hypothetical protein